MKKQFWLRPEQAEIVVECLLFVHEKLDEGTVLSDAHRMAGRYMYRRIEEILEIFGRPIQPPPNKKPE